MTAGLWRIAHWKRIPIHLHWSALLGLVWFGATTRSLVWTCVSFAAFFGLMAIHELGHAIAARARHVPVHEIRLYLLHGLCRHSVPARANDRILIAWGGVLAQAVVLLAAFATEAALSTFAPATNAALQPLFAVLIGANAFMIVFNLLPIPPLDGHVAWRILRPLPGMAVARWRAGVSSVRRSLYIQRRRREMKRDAENKVVDLLERMKKK